ncbi:hypothetical protein J7E63_15700 [Bacillus sp. ISL-75]|uniref:hypothetical protein n=1 Tax=Bacillus sp. ISL-75 TaxID=2819137 RepID=UPI001BE52562|nr:hypothetical protein [Bacillus sp. ISL-75]MBT2728373.1 hypothetical protein [Bacillus sp. ISL-75]
MNDLLFYDIEVFSHNTLVVFKDINKKLIKVFHNNFTKLAEFIEGKTLVGFNNYYYDDKILTYMLELKPQYLIKQLNDRIISGEKVRYINKPPFRSLDVFQQIDVSKPSLKKIEGNMGRQILESSVSFSINRPLTPEEFDQVLDYCSYDVDTTIDIYIIRDKSYFQPKFSLLEMLGNEKAAKWNTTTISANLLLNKPLPKWDSVRIPPEMWLKVPEEVRAMWLDKSKIYGVGILAEKMINIEAFDCNIQFGFGGLHGAHKTIKKERNVKLLDVKSMYPSIILILKALGAASEKYKAILDKRLAIKHVDEILSEALKLILNSVYGNLNNQYSMLYNPMAALSVCIYGQIALYDLCKRLAPFVTIVNINTDGVAFIPHDQAYIIAYKEWEKEFLLDLEEKIFSLLVQKDVNNYIAVKKGGIICKGGDVNRYEEDAFFKNNNARILDIALVEKLVNGKDIYEIIESNLDKPHLYQYILKAGNTYLGSFDELGNEYNKVNRVFASKKSGFCLYKRRFDDGLVRFADAPINMFLWNGDCSEIDNFNELLDLNHYYQLVLKRLERWI